MEMLSAKEAAALLGVRTSTVYAYASRGLLGAGGRGPGKQAKYPRELVETLRKKAAARSGHGAVAAAALRWGEPVLDSAITELTVRGPVYRGKRAIELVDHSFEDVAELLVGRPLNRSLPIPLGKTTGLQALLETAVRLAPKLRAGALDTSLTHCLACVAGPHRELASREKTIAGAIGVSLLGRKVTKPEWKILNACLVLMADHELNPSTFAARIAASAGAPWIDCVIAALATSAGTRHASACELAEAMWARWSKGSAVDFVRRELAAHETLAGFDAGAYPHGDPRAQRLLSMLAPNERVDAFLEAVDQETRQLPAVDFALISAARQLGLPAGSATCLFVVGRTVGWFAHVLEQQESRAPIRPRARMIR